METTNEIKAKVFAQYLGQKFRYDGSLGTIRYLHGITRTFACQDETGDLFKIERSKLLLKQLSAITDEDAIMCYVITDPRRGVLSDNEYHVQKVKEKDNSVCSVIVTRIDVLDEHLNILVPSGDLLIFEDKDGEHSIEERVKNQAQVFQFLQSRGYDLPQYLLGGKTLHESGLAIYE